MFSFDENLSTLIKYVGNSEPLCLESSNLDTVEKYSIPIALILSVLNEKRLENFNWFSFCVGLCIRVKKDFDKTGAGELGEVFTITRDFLLNSIDNAKRRIDSKNLLKSVIGSKGWHIIGYESLDNYDGSEQISNRKNLKLKKEGKILEEDKQLFSVVAKNEKYTLYYLPPIEKYQGYYGDRVSKEIKDKRVSRKRLLCKYGKGTEWCTANPSGDYDISFTHMPIYILHQIVDTNNPGHSKPIYQFTEGQFRDTSNDPVYCKNWLNEEIFSFLSSAFPEGMAKFWEDEDEDDEDDYEDYEDDEDDDEDYEDDDEDYEDDEDEDDEDDDEDDEDDEEDWDDEEWEEDDEDDEDDEDEDDEDDDDY